MAKRTPVSSSNSPADNFSDLTIQGKSGFVAFPASMTKEIEKLTRDAGSPARKALQKIANLKLGDAPVGRELAGGIYFIEIGFSGKDTKGFAYLPPDRQKDMAPTILATMTYGDYAEILKKKPLQAELKGQVDGLRAMFNDRTPGPNQPPKRVLKTHKVYSTSMGITG